MSIIQFKEANCKSCYQCIRHCAVKAISFHDEQARIMEDACVLCGKCTLVCHQNAKQIDSDVPKIKEFLQSGAKVFVSVAPSYVSAYPGASFLSSPPLSKSWALLMWKRRPLGRRGFPRSLPG